ncbi:GlcG/HbpS family heme-binding protein [Leeia oryzae]|uniref:GlcG/HbpS family heme-binding protein n=1 Tax=Leeia oryzae TaxID=356662 RepID=UPI000367E466|nr:heme-binding protein [Leeia oryzae]
MLEAKQVLTLSAETANALVTAALARAQQDGLNVCVAVVDHAGHLLAFLRSAQAPLHSTDIAIDKAYTAVSFSRATHLWEPRLAEAGQMLKMGLANRPRFVGFGGGYPIMISGMAVGGIGVSGGTETQDMVCATFALDLVSAGGKVTR